MTMTTKFNAAPQVEAQKTEPMLPGSAQRQMTKTLKANAAPQGEAQKTELLLRRMVFKDDMTLGKLYLAAGEGLLPGEAPAYICDTLEPKRRNLGGGERKIKGRTAIPEGRYPLVISKSRRFRRWLPTLVGVPRFSGILIHTGNTERDTEGCILVGTNSGDTCLVFSQRAFAALMSILTAAPGPMWITVE